MNKVLNYSFEAEESMKKWCREYYASGYQQDAYNVGSWAQYIGKAVHFSVPDNGMILDDDFKGIVGKPIRLPFPKITLSYDNAKNNIGVSTKVIVIAEEREYSSLTDEMKQYAKNCGFFQNKFIMVNFCWKPANEKEWDPSMAGFFMPFDWDKKFTSNDDIYGFTHAKGKYHIWGLTVFNMWKLIYEMAPPNKERDLYSEKVREIQHTLMGPVIALLEFLEALTCSNVSSEPVKKVTESSNRVRKKFGLPPEYETRVLTIHVPGKGSEKSGGQFNYTHRSPREHLRRGHIRKYQSGKNIWINSCVVGAKDNGTIAKSYKVVHSS